MAENSFRVTGDSEKPADGAGPGGRREAPRSLEPADRSALADRPVPGARPEPGDRPQPADHSAPADRPEPANRSAPDDRPQPPDRYEPLPGLARLPGWVWRRLPRAGRIWVALLPVVAIALIVILAPGIDRGKDERSRAEAERREESRAARAERIRQEQQPRFGSGAVAGRSRAARQRLLDDATASVDADARRRVAAGSLAGPIRGVECEPFPRTSAGRGAHEDPARRYGRYSCLAATSEFARGERTEAGAIGHPYRLRIEFETGDYAYCKVSGRAGEGAIGTQPIVAVPRVCGGA